MKYMIGMDGGGTKTIAYIADVDGNPRQKIISGVLNVNGQSEHNVEKTVRHIAGQVKESGYLIEDCEKIGIGMAGYSNAEARETMVQYVRQEGFSCPIYLFGDHETALSAAFSGGDGIILVAGTGSICYGKGKNGVSVRAGGYGPIMGDEGSAYALAVKILKAVVKAEDGRERSTMLRALVFRTLKLASIEELIRFVYDKDTNKREVASLAKLIEEAVAGGDEAACKIERECAEELCQLFSAVKSRIPEEKNLVFAGSVLHCNSRIREMVTKGILRQHPEMLIAEENIDAAKGALYLIRDNSRRYQQ